AGNGGVFTLPQTRSRKEKHHAVLFQAAKLHAEALKRPRFRPRFEALNDRCVPAQVHLTVSSLAEAGPGTLRDAILSADAGSHPDKFTIGFGVPPRSTCKPRCRT